MSDVKWPDPATTAKQVSDLIILCVSRRIPRAARPQKVQPVLRQFQRDTVLACAEEVGHTERCHLAGGNMRWDTCPACKLEKRAKEMS